MMIERSVEQDGIQFQVRIELTAAELRNAFEECQRNYRLEDITNHLSGTDQSDLSGYTAEEVTRNPELMGAILQSFFKHESCELPENDVLDECIRTVLSDHRNAES